MKNFISFSIKSKNIFVLLFYALLWCSWHTCHSAQNKAPLRTIEKFRTRKEAYVKAQKTTPIKDSGMVGTLTADKIKEWIEREGLVSKKFGECLTVEESTGGGSTESLFLVLYSPDCPKKGEPKLLFILKETPPYQFQQELSSLNLVQNNPQIRTLGKLKDPSLPQLTFAETFYTYKDTTGALKYFLLIHAAKGSSLGSWLSTDEIDLSTKREILQAFGAVLAHFHKKFMNNSACLVTGGNNLDACTTITHGDLHPENVFFDGTFFYFIDLSTMAKSLKQRQSFLYDVARFCTFILQSWKRHTHEPVTPENPPRIYNAFLGAYVETLTSNPTDQDRIWNDISYQAFGDLS